MSFERPTLTEIDARVRGDIVANMDAVPIVRKGTVLGAIARGVAGASHMAHGFIDWVFLQIFADTADSENLERQAGFRGITRSAAATSAGNVTLSGQDGAVLLRGSSLVSAEGIEVETSADATIVGGVASVAVAAVETGAASNLDAGTALTIVSPPPGLTGAAVADGGLSGGTSAQTDQQLLAQYLLRLRRPPHGGNENDYRQWAVEAGVVSDVNRVFVSPGEMGLGTVTVRFTVDDAPHGPAPSAEELETVRAYIDTQRPVTAGDFFVLAPVLLAVDHTLSVTPDTPEVRAAVTAKLADLYELKGEPGAGMPISHIRAAISGATGEEDHDLTAPAASIAAAPGIMLVLGEVTFT